MKYPQSIIFPALALASTAALVASATTTTTTDPIKTIAAPCSGDIDAACIKWGISKLLGLAVVALSFLLKVPIIKNMLSQGSAEGLTLDSLYLELVSYACSAAYNTLIGAPLSTYAETLIIGFQIFIMIVLTWQYNKIAFTHRALFAAAAVGFVIVINMLPSQYWPSLMAVCSLMAMGSRLTQIAANFKNKHTGVLSVMSTGMQIGGNAVRIFTTMTEVDDIAVLSSYVISFVLNSIVLIQIILFWSNTNKLQDAKKSTAAAEKDNKSPEKTKVVAPGPVTQDDDTTVQRGAKKSRKE